MTYEKYLARKSKDNREQTVEKHLDNTAELAKGFFKFDERFGKLARAAARLHDVGKFSEEFIHFNINEQEEQ